MPFNNFSCMQAPVWLQQRAVRLLNTDFGLSQEREAELFLIWSTNINHYRELGVTLQSPSLNLTTFLCYINQLQLDDNTVPTLWGKRVWPVGKGRVESWGGEKKPVLISCGLVFPAGCSTEREAAAVAWGDQSSQKNVTPTTSFSWFLSLLIFHIHISLFDPLLFPFIPLCLSFPRNEHDLHQNFSAH